VTPAIGIFAWVLSKNPRPRTRDLISAAIPVLMSAQVLATYFFSQSGASPQYLTFVLTIVILTNTAMPLSYRAARGATLVTFALLLMTVALTRRMETGFAVLQCLAVAICGYVTLHTNSYRERKLRRTFLRRLQDRLRGDIMESEARQDGLTGLANRRKLELRAASLWTCEDAEVSPVAVILFDVDFFKTFNDNYGHPAGDACLRRIAGCVEAELRGSEDLAARYGGEEFMLLLPRTSRADALKLAERLRNAILALGIAHRGSDRAGVVTASFGVAAAPISAASFTALTAVADEALYAAKRGGRNRVAASPAVWPVAA
jgi:diguanylate cyclase (GGDEF)-like protein